MPDTTSLAISALTRAWIATTTVVMLLAVVVALSQVWDGALYLRGLRAALALGM